MPRSSPARRHAPRRLIVRDYPVLGRSLGSNTSELDRSLDLDINYKAVKTFGDRLAVGFEHYSEVGKADRPDFSTSSAQVTYAIVEFKTKSHFEIQIGVGHGWSDPATSSCTR